MSFNNREVAFAPPSREAEENLNTEVASVLSEPEEAAFTEETPEEDKGNEAARLRRITEGRRNDAALYFPS